MATIEHALITLNLVCTSDHTNNLRTYLLKQTKQQEKKIKKFAEDFYSWDIEKREKWSKS